MVSDVLEASGGMHTTTDFFAVVQPSVVPAPRATMANDTDAPGLRASRGPWPSDHPRRQTLALTSMLFGSLAVAASLILTSSVLPSNAFVLGGLDQASLTAATSTGAGGASSTDTAKGNVSGRFGDAVTFKNGLVVSVAPAVSFIPTDYATGDNQAANVTMIVTVTNTTKSSLAPYLRVSAVSGAAKTPGTQIVDARSGVNSAPAALLKAGQVVSYLVGFSVADPDSITVSLVEPNGSTATIAK